MTRSTRRTAAAAVIRDEEEGEGSDMQMSAPELEHDAEDEVDEGEDDNHGQDVEEEGKEGVTFRRLR